MKEFIVILVVLYVCIKYPTILLISIAGLGIWCITSIFNSFEEKKTDQPANKEEVPSEEAKGPEFYTKEGKPIEESVEEPEFITPYEYSRRKENLDPSETDAKQAIPVAIDSIESETD